MSWSSNARRALIASAGLWRVYRRRVLVLGLAFILLPVLALVVFAAVQPLPPALTEPAREHSLEVLDRNGRLIRRVRTKDAELTETVRLDQLSPWVVPALLAAEDARFYKHPGIDPLAIARALGDLIWQRKIVSGASTITQQLARNVVERPRTFAGKFREMAIALRIEASLSKQVILEQYLNRVSFGPNLRGIGAASWFYFDKPVHKLELAEAAALAALPRGPSLYDPRRSTERLKLRRDRILERMRDASVIDDQTANVAIAEPIRVSKPFAEGGVEHLVRALAAFQVLPLRAGKLPERVQTTIDLTLQREVEELSRLAARGLKAYGASAVSVLVLENQTGDVLAYVGSPDFFSDHALGQNDGAKALRQPGSTLKPFVYAAAIERLGLTGASILPDVELSLATTNGAYSPRNYDGRFHGPVRLREALASSLNVPAVYVAQQVGPPNVLALLRQSGFASLTKDAAHYGAAIALGDGEVRLTELAQAYAMLARRGQSLKVRYVQRVWHTDGSRADMPHERGGRVLKADTTDMLTSMLSDSAARIGAFGAQSVLDLPFPVAVKTGTSKGFRDNWTVGYTPEITVAVWAGNFDARPMAGSTGVTGAGPLFHEVMRAAMRGRAQAAFVTAEQLVEVPVCALSGKRPNPSCPHRVFELVQGERRDPGECDMHEHVRIDPQNGLRAGPACADAEERVFERYPAEFVSFAHAARRPLAPSEYSPRCPVRDLPGSAVLRITSPSQHARYVIDRAGPPRQELVLSAVGTARTLRFVLDGRVLAQVGAPFRLPWQLVPGRHSLVVTDEQGRASEAIEFEVL